MIWTVALLTAGALAADPCAPEVREAVHAELEAHWEADQSDRENAVPHLAKNDKKRVKAVGKLVDKGRICEPEDAFYAAWILQRSNDPKRALQAHELATQAMNARIPRGAWLAAATFDLMHVTHGKAQWYGTQGAVRDGRPCLYPVDPSITDEQRAQYEVGPITEVYRRLLDAHQLPTAPPTRESLDQERLWCPPQK